MAITSALVTTAGASARENGQPRLCSPRDVRAHGGSNGATGNIVFFVTVTNRSRTPCRLLSRPRLALVDAAGRRLPVRQTALARMPGYRALSLLRAKRQAHVVAFWSNWCRRGYRPGAGLGLRLTLARGQPRILARGSYGGWPRCDFPARASALAVLRFSRVVR